jgi:hypothetical protein
MKYSIFFLLVILASCADTRVYLKYPTPKMRMNQKGFNSDLIGKYAITDSILDKGFFSASNEMHHPEIFLPADTSVYFTFQSKVILSENSIISKEIYTVYLFKSMYETFDNKHLDGNDSLIFLGDTVKIILKAQIDTLFNISNKDILRKYKDHYVLNKWHEEGYQPILLSRRNKDVLDILDLNKNDLADYYRGFDTDKMELKVDLINNGETINLKNSELKFLIKNKYFTTRFKLQKANQ